MCTLLLNARTFNVEVYKNKNFKTDLYNQLVNSFPNVVNSDMANLIVSMLDLEPTKRPSASLLLKHVQDIIDGKPILNERASTIEGSESPRITPKRRVALSVSKTPLSPIQKLMYVTGNNRIRLGDSIYDDFVGNETNLSEFGIDLKQMIIEEHQTVYIVEGQSRDRSTNSNEGRTVVQKCITAFDLNQWMLILTSPCIHTLPLFMENELRDQSTKKEQFMQSTLLTYSYYMTPQSFLKKCFETVCNIPVEFFEEVLFEESDVNRKQMLEPNEKYPYWKYCQSVGEYRLFAMLELLLRVSIMF